MRILALDTSRAPGSIALAEDDHVVGQLVLPNDVRTAKSLIPSVQSLLAELQWEPQDVGLVAVTIGPGSFTGLRIGVTFAKTWAYARKCEIIGLESLLVLAHQAQSSALALETVMNAERKELFVARFERQSVQEPWQLTRETCLRKIDEWVNSLRPGTAVIGDGLKGLTTPFPEGIEIEAEERWVIQAATLARLAWQAYQAGERTDAWQLMPRYYRESAAEEKKRTPR